MSSTNYSENFCEAINIVASSIIQGLSFDRTILCTIVNTDNAQKGEYSVSDGSSTFTAMSSNKTYKVNTQVYVLIPNGDYTQQKLIVSEYVSGVENEKEDYSFPFETIIPGETIEIDDEEKDRGLVANERQQKNNGHGIKIIDLTKPDHAKYQLNKESIYTRLGIQASFKTFFENSTGEEVYIENGDYSIVISLSGADKDGKAIKDKKYLFNCSDFFGNPYRLDAYTEQSIVFNISEFKKITSIDVQFQESGNFYSINSDTGEKIFFKTTQDENGKDKANLYVTDLKFIFGFDINEYETNDLLINNLEELNYKNNQKKNLQLNWIRKRTDQSSLISLYKKSMLKLYCKDLWYLWNARDEDLNFPDGSNDLEKKVLENKFIKDISFYWYKYLIKSGVSDKILDEELWTLAAYRNNLNYQNSDFDEKIYGENYLGQIKTVTDNPFKFDFRTSVDNSREKIKMAVVFNGCLRKKTLTLTEGIHIGGTEEGALENEVIVLEKVEKPYYLSEDGWKAKLQDEFKKNKNNKVDPDNSNIIKIENEEVYIIKKDEEYNKYIYPYENEVYYTPDTTVDIEDIFNNKDELDAEFKEKNKETGIKVVYLDESKYIDTKINLKGTKKEFILLDWVRQYNKEQIEVTIDETDKSVTVKDPLQYTISTAPEFLSAEEFENKTKKEKEEVKDSNNKPRDVYRNFELVPIKVFKSNEIIYTNTTDSAVYNTTNLVENIELNCIDQLKGNYFIYGFDDHVGQDTASCANRKIQVKFDSINSEDVDSENIKMAWRIPKELSMIMPPEEFTIEDTTNFSSSVSSDKKTVKWIDGDIIAEAMATAKTEHANYWIDNKQATYRGYWISSQIEVKNSASGKEDSTKEYNFSIPYAINDLYRAAWANNTISCFVWKKIKGANDNQVTVNKSEKTLNFGHLGTNGTKYSFNIRFGCPYTITFDENGKYKSSKKKSDLIQPFLDDNVENVGVEIIPTLHTGSEALTIDPKKIEWSWHVPPYFTEKRNVKIDGKEQEKTITYRTVITHKPTGKCFIRTCRTNNYEKGLSGVSEAEIKNKNLKTSINFHSKNHCAILKATIEYKSKKLDAYLPIPMRFDTTVGVYSGADKVIYNSLGTEPYYHDTEHMLYSKKNEPFEDSRFEVYIDREKSSTPIDKSYYPYFETGSILTYNQKNYRLYVQPHIFDTIYGYNSSHNKDDGSGKLLKFNTDLTPKKGNDAETTVYDCKSNGNTLTWYTKATKKEDEKRTGYLYTYDTNILKAPKMFYSENAKTPVSIIGFKTGTIKWGGHEYILYKNNNPNYDFDDFDGFYGYNENKIDKEKSKGTLLKFKLEDLSYSGAVSIYNVTLPTESNSYQLTGYTKENSTNSKYKIDATKKGRTTCFVQPIFIAQNRFGNTIVNEWDGKLQINEEDNYILSMMMGAGIKETDNSFSGVLMGEVQRSNTKTIGLFGYDHGEEAFGFKRDGTAFIGKSGTGRIEFNGKEGIITSSNYSNNKIGARLNLTTGDFNLKSFGGGEVQISGIGSDANPFLRIVDSSEAVTYKPTISIGSKEYTYTFYLYRTSPTGYVYGYSEAFSNKYKEDVKKTEKDYVALVRFSLNDDGTLTLNKDPIAWVRDVKESSNYTYLNWMTDDKKEKRTGELFSLGKNKKVTIFEARRGRYYLQSSKYPQGIGMNIDLETGILISKNSGGTITIDPSKSDALFHIKTSNDNDYSYKNKTLINIGKDKYYLQSADYTSAGKTGMNINLINGKLISKNTGGTVTIDPSQSEALFKVEDNKGNFLMNIGTSDYYLKSADYVQRVNGVKINLGSGGFSIASELPEDSSSAAGIVISNASNYLQITKNITKLSESIVVQDYDDEQSGASNVFEKKVDIFVHPFGEELILRECTTNKFYRAKMAQKSSSSSVRWVPKDLPILLNIDDSYTITSSKGNTYTGYQYNLIIGPEIYFNLFKEAIKLKETFNEADYAIEINNSNWSYDKYQKTITHKGQSIGNNGDTYDCVYKLAYLGNPKVNNQISFLETDSNFLANVPDALKDKVQLGHANSVAYCAKTSSFFVAATFSKNTYNLLEYKYNSSSKKWSLNTFRLTDDKNTGLGDLWEIAIFNNQLYALGPLTYDSTNKVRKGKIFIYDIDEDSKQETTITINKNKNFTAYALTSNLTQTQIDNKEVSIATYQGMDVYQYENGQPIYVFLPLYYRAKKSNYSHVLHIRNLDNEFIKNIKFVNPDGDRYEIEEVSFKKENSKVYMYMSASALGSPRRMTKVFKILFENYLKNNEFPDEIDLNTISSVYYVYFKEGSHTTTSSRDATSSDTITVPNTLKNVTPSISGNTKTYSKSITQHKNETTGETIPAQKYKAIITSSNGKNTKIDYQATVDGVLTRTINDGKTVKTTVTNYIDFAQGFTVGEIDNEKVFFFATRNSQDKIDNDTICRLVVNGIDVASKNTLKLYKSTLLDISTNKFYFKSANYSHEDSNGVGFTGTFFDLNTGKLITSNADITGKITATSGEIGGWTITSTDIRNKTNKDNYFLLSGKGFTSDNKTYFIAAKHDGVMKFTVDTNGLLFARNADIGGTITATSGSIGNWKIGNACLYYGSTAKFGSGYAFLYPAGKSGISGPGGITGKSWIFGAGANFGVTTAGELYAKAGNIGGWTIGSSCLYTGSSTISFSNNNIFLYPKGKSGINGPGGISGKSWVFGAGANFGVTNTGELYAKAGNIGGWAINSDSITSENVTLGNNVISALTDKWNQYGVGVKLVSNGTISFQFKNKSGKITEHSFIGQVGNDDDGITGITFSLGSTFEENTKNRHTIFNKGSYGHQFWGTVYFTNGYSGASSSGTTSDLRLKNSIQNLSSNYEILFSHLKPIIYKYNDGTSNRYHSGFIAQDVLTAIQESDLTTQDFAALMIQPVKYNEFNGLPDIYSLRYEEFIALNTHMIQKCLKRIDELENEIKTLKAQL